MSYPSRLRLGAGERESTRQRDERAVVSFDDPELIACRADEVLDTSRLEPYLRERLDVGDAPLEIAQFGGGHANLTYLLAFGEHEFVLRRPPLGPIAPGSHDMAREHRVLSKLYAHFDLAPRCYLFSDDETIIGVPFQIMERRHGQVIRRTIPTRYRSDADMLRRIGEMMVDVLAALHSVDREEVGLADLGHPAGYVQRQVNGWAKRWHASAHAPDCNMNRLIAWLLETLPTSGEPSLLHNDYKLDNILVSLDDPARAVAVLDWDMCTSGDPLMDLGYLLTQWVQADDAPEWIRNSSLPTHVTGFPTRDEVIARYAERTARDVDSIGWYQAFSAMKFAGVVQQIFIRYHRGQTQDERFAHYDQRARLFIRQGCRLAGITYEAD